MPGQKVKAQFLLLNPLCSPLSKQNCSTNETQKLFHSRNESCRKGFPSFQFFPKLNPRKQTVRGWVGSREELCVCLPEHSVLSFWHCVFSPGLDVATGWEVDLPEDGKKAMTNKVPFSSSLLACNKRRWGSTQWTLSPHLWSTQPCYSALCWPTSSRSPGAKLTAP